MERMGEEGQRSKKDLYGTLGFLYRRDGRRASEAGSLGMQARESVNGARGLLTQFYQDEIGLQDDEE